MTFKFGDFEEKLCLMTLKSRADSAIDGVFSTAAKDLESYAKLNAPWTDRTGNARRTLTGESRCLPFSLKKVSVIGKMHYSPKLELFHGGRYSILFPTILKNAEGILRDVVNTVGGVKL